MITNHNFPLSVLRLCLTVGSFLLTVSLCNAVYGQQFFQWTDDKGVTHYSDKPPQGVEATVIGKKRRRPISSEEDAEPEADSEEQPNQQANNAQSQKNPERCQAERDRLQVLMENSRIRMQNADGTDRLLSPEEVQNEIDMTRKAIDYFCE